MKGRTIKLWCYLKALLILLTFKLMKLVDTDSIIAKKFEDCLNMAEVAQEVLLFLNRPPPKIRRTSGADIVNLYYRICKKDLSKMIEIKDLTA